MRQADDIEVRTAHNSQKGCSEDDRRLGIARRNRHCFRLGTLLLLGVIAGCEEKPVRQVRRLGGRVIIDKYRTGEVFQVCLDSTKVTDADLATLTAFKKLRQLSLRNTKVTGVGLTHLKGLTELRELQLALSGVTDRELVHIGGLTQLRSLDLTDCKVTDAGLEHLKGLTSLEDLILGATGVTDAGLVHLEELPKLRYLCLYDTNVTDAGVRILQNARPGCKIARKGDQIGTRPIL